MKSASVSKTQMFENVNYRKLTVISKLGVHVGRIICLLDYPCKSTGMYFYFRRALLDRFWEDHKICGSANSAKLCEMGSKKLKKFWKDDSGATAIEYGLIMTLIAIACIVGFRALSGASGGAWDDTSSQIVEAMNS